MDTVQLYSDFFPTVKQNPPQTRFNKYKSKTDRKAFACVCRSSITEETFSPKIRRWIHCCASREPCTRCHRVIFQIVSFDPNVMGSLISNLTSKETKTSPNNDYITNVTPLHYILMGCSHYWPDQWHESLGGWQKKLEVWWDGLVVQWNNLRVSVFFRHVFYFPECSWKAFIAGKPVNWGQLTLPFKVHSIWPESNSS